MNKQPTNEVRRLRAQVQALRAAVDRAATAIEQVDEHGRHPSAWELGKVLTSLFAVMNDTKHPHDSEPVWIQRDHLQKAREAPFLCRVEPTPRLADFVPLYERTPAHYAPLEDQRDALLEALRYWLPDETMIPAGHEAKWNEAVAAIKAVAEKT